MRPCLGHRAIDQPPDLVEACDVSLHDGVVAERKFAGKLAQAVEPPRAERQLGAARGEIAGGRFAEPAARAGDDDHFAGDAFVHALDLPLFAQRPTIAC